jgi:PAS domain S-box-containing protein
VAISCICTLLVLLSWLQNRRRYEGTHLWVLNFVCQTLGILLIALRGLTPDWLSIISGNALIIAGAVIMYAGLNRFLGMNVSQRWNCILLAVFILVQIFFTYMRPHVEVRILNFGAALAIISFQGMWLMFFRTDAALRGVALGVGVAFAGYFLISMGRIVDSLGASFFGQDFFELGTFEALAMVSYTLMTVLLTYTLSLILNRRLLNEMKTEEEKFSKAFQSSPYAIIFTRASDGKIIEANEGFLKLFGYTRAEIVDKTMLNLNIWRHEGDRRATVEELLKNGSVREWEFNFMKKSGDMVCGLFSSDVLVVNNEPSMLSSIIDITERKRNQVEREELIGELQKALLDVKTLSGMLPICSSCKKIRDDQGYWNAIESYISNHSEAEFSHGLCPECARKLYPEFVKERKDDRDKP